MRKFFLVLTLLFFARIYGLDNSDIKLIIDFEKNTFRLSSSVDIEIKIVNLSQGEKLLKLSPLDYESLYFMVRTPENELLKYRDEYKLKVDESASSYDEVKEIRLLPGESISRKIDLSRIFDFRKEGYYYIKILYYPDPDVKTEFIESEYYKFLLKPPSVVEQEIKERDKKRKIELEDIKKLPPYEVVDNMLDAKMKKDWDRFLLHFDVERLIYSFQNYGKAYEAARGGKYKLEILEDFKKYLTTHWQDRILSYKVLESYVRPNEATVDADVEYKVREYSYVLRYTFKLYKNSLDEWKIYDYTVLRVK
ncbi:MAG: hypothetical protein ACP5QT_01105 [Brevinematia bacterium]